MALLQQQMEVMPAIEPEPCTLGLEIHRMLKKKKNFFKNPFLL